MFVLIFVLLFGFGALSYVPYPTATTVQGVLQGDTVPVYFSSKSDIPNGPNTFWYKSVSTRVNSTDELNTSVSFIFVKGSDACMPLHVKTESFESSNITLSPSDVLALKNASFLPIASTIDLNIDIFESSSAQIELYVVDNQADFKCFIERRQNDCNYAKVYSLEPNTNAIEFHPSFSSYYYFVISIQGEVTVTFSYSYTSNFSYYNISDYSSDDAYQTCIIEPGVSSSNICEFEVANRRGCLIVSSPTPENGAESGFIELDVHVMHEKFTIPSVACLTFGSAFVILFVCCLIAYAWISCRGSVRKN